MRLYPDTAHDMRQVDGEMWNALLMRSEHKLETCLKNGGNPNSRWTGEGLLMERPTPLNFLLKLTHGEADAHSVKRTRRMLDLLLSHGADPMIRSGDEFSFQLAAKYDHPACTLPIFKKLLKGADKETIDRRVERSNVNISSLAHTFRSRSVTWARELLRLGADPWMMQEDGQPCWIHLLRSSMKSLDYNRHPHAAYLVVELAKTRGSEAVLEIIEREVDLLQAGPARQDSYGGRAMQRLTLWLGKQGELDHEQLNRLLACTGEYAEPPLRELFELGANPNTIARNGKPLLWKALEDGDEDTLGALFNHPDTDLCHLSGSGMDAAHFLRNEKRMGLSGKTRAMWIARVEQQLLNQHAPAQPPGPARRVRL